MEMLDTDRQVATLVVLFFISLLAVSFPAISQRSQSFPIPKLLFFIGKHFGTGVILSTAFHLVQDSFESLQSPIVKEKHPRICNETGFIILVSLLAIFLVEYISTSYVDYLHAEPSPPPTAVSAHTPLPATESMVDASERSPLISRNSRPPHLVLSTPSREHYLTSIVTNSPRYSRSNENFYIINDLKHHLRNGEYHLTEQGKCLCVSVCADHGRGGSTMKPSTPVPEHDDHDHDNEKKAWAGRRRQVVGILVLQLGIMIHSLVIGLTLALTTGTEFTSLATAIAFHQFFEGLSLGIRIAALPPSSLRRHWLAPTLSFLFALTTPSGMGLGMLIFTRNAGPHTSRMLLTQGLMSAVSAGMLIYVATVEMLAGDFVFGNLGGHGHTSEGSHGHSHGTEFIENPESEHGEGDGTGLGKKTLAVSSLLGGVVIMGLVSLGE